MPAKKKIPPVLEILRDNIVKHGNPLALKPRETSAWAKNLELPVKGDILFYTGSEYQLLPFIDSLVKTLKIVDPSSTIFSWLMEARKIVNMTGINAEKIYASILAKDKERYYSINYKAVHVLRKLGYDLCYDRQGELYSGALLYELGFWKDLDDYAQRVADSIRKTEAKTVVCISPHAAEMFRKVYPQIVDFPDVQVKTFIEMVWEKRHLLPKIPCDSLVVIHDSCRLARELDVSQEIRDILDEIGVKYVEPFRSKEWTTCCGGPSKMLFPDISKIVAGRRVIELSDTGAEKALISCPYCLSALQSEIDKGNGVILEDIIEFLYRGLEAQCQI
ncbi:MAG: Lactate utilization protein A [Candidatus Dichloromethanomonas elyunquensis]|nr:MAG: Lactate utilization protein A [Candidatus Dichloromethanomonas elyunquensis]